MGILNSYDTTSLRYRCQVAWPSIGSIAARPTKNRIALAASSVTTISPQSNITRVLVLTALIEMPIAVAVLVGLSKSSGNPTTEIDNAANAKITPQNYH